MKTASAVVMSIIVFTTMTTDAQVYNTGQILVPRTFSLTAVGLAYIEGSRQFYPGGYANIGFGLAKGVDLAVNARLGKDRMLFGGDIEWGILRKFPALSLTTGAHGFRHFGLDAALNLAFPIKNVVVPYIGVDSEYNWYPDGDFQLPLWGFGGIEIALRKRLRLLVEFDGVILEPAAHMLGAGIVLFF